MCRNDFGPNRRFQGVVLILVLLLFASIPTAAADPGRSAQTGSLIITGVIDGPLSGGMPKAVEVFAVRDIPDLSVYGLETTTNGSGAAGAEYVFSGAAAAGDFLYVTSEETGFAAYFGFPPTDTSRALSINGDDAVVLYQGGSIVDTFGEPDVDGTGEPWEYMDGWAYRAAGSGPDGASFVLDNWSFSGPNALDGAVDNLTSGALFPAGSYTAAGNGEPGEESAPTFAAVSPAHGEQNVASDSAITITFSEPVNVSDGWYAILCTSGAVMAAVSGGPTGFTLTPDAPFAPGDICTVTVAAASVSDVDEEDPPDTMVANHAFNFVVAPALASGCGDPATLIHEVQGSDAASPLTGSDVVIEGVVVGDFQADEVAYSDLGGFFVQEEDADADADPNTSEGIFVYAPGAPGENGVSEGDVVRISGTVTEFNGQTQLTDLTRVEVCGTAELPAPADVLLPTEPRTALERYEGMLVRLPQHLVISEYFNFDRYGEIVLAVPETGQDRQYTPTAFVEPGASASQELAENERSRITLDDGRSGSAFENPDPARHPNGEAFTLENRFRGGDVVQNVVGILEYRFGDYRIQPTAGAEYVPRNPRTASPDPVGGSLTVASFNVLNYFTTLNSRGADTAEEFARQRAKIIAAIGAIDADIVGLIEIENNDAAIADLVNGLNNALGAGTYAAIDTGVIGTDAIKVAFIYKPGTVAPLGAPAVLDDSSFTNPFGADTPKNRPAVAQTFREPATGGALTVVVNHLKSKGSGCGAGDDHPQQGNCNGTRTAAAQVLVDWLATDPTGSGDPDYLLVGDLNAYDQEDPIDQLRAGADDTPDTGDDFVDLAETFGGEFAYSYVFDGQFGYLDYALANMSLLPQVTGTTEWHINADEPDLLDYDMTFKKDAQDALYEPDPYRSSDHDPVVVGLDLTSDGTTTLPGTAVVPD